MYYPFNSKPIKKKHCTDPKGYCVVKDFCKGDYIRLTSNKSKKTYIRGDYDRSKRKYHLVDCNDVWGNGRYVKGETLANDDFIY